MHMRGNPLKLRIQGDKLMQTRSQAEMQGPTSFNARFDELETRQGKLLELSTSNNTLLNSVVRRVDKIDTRTEVLTGELHDQGVKLDLQEKRVAELEGKLQQSMEYIDQLENQHRQNNLRMLNVPEKEEKDQPMIHFLIKLFEEKWSLTLKEQDFERAHRVGVIKDNVKHPRAIIFKLHHYHKKLEIWKKTRGGQEGCNFKVVMDMLIQLRRKRAEMWPLREQLHRLNLKTYIWHPAILCVDDGGRVKSFKTLEEAKEELKHTYTSID